MRIVVDLDETLCTGKPYEMAKPLPRAKAFLERCKAAGHTVIIYTARGMGSSAGNSGTAIATIGLLTLSQLSEWGFPYDEIYFGKPAGDVYIDDKSISNIEMLHL